MLLSYISSQSKNKKRCLLALFLSLEYAFSVLFAKYDPKNGEVFILFDAFFILIEFNEISSGQISWFSL